MGAQALADLDAAERIGADRAAVAGERAAILQATGCYRQAQNLYRSAAARPPGFTTLGALDYRNGLMWHHHGDLAAARTWLDAACRRLPAYAPAQARLAQIDAAHGNHQAAIACLGPLASSSDDPEYAAQLSRAPTSASRHAAYLCS